MPKSWTTNPDSDFESTNTERPNPTVRVRRHQPDIENLGKQVAARLGQILEREHPRCLFVNPIVTITCDKPTEEFFSIVRKRQAEWCKRSRTTFGRRASRKVRNWANANGPLKKRARFFDRALCFTGVLFVDGDLIPPHAWGEVKTT